MLRRSRVFCGRRVRYTRTRVRTRIFDLPSDGVLAAVDFFLFFFFFFGGDEIIEEITRLSEVDRTDHKSTNHRPPRAGIVAVYILLLTTRCWPIVSGRRGTGVESCNLLSIFDYTIVTIIVITAFGLPFLIFPSNTNSCPRPAEKKNRILF